MTGRPRRRARLAAAQGASGEPPRPGPELPPRPPDGAPAAEMRAYFEQVRGILRAELRELRRPQREADLRAGRVRPRNRAEVELFGAGPIDKSADDERDPEDMCPAPERPEEPVQVSEATPEEIGRWMADRLQRDGQLNQPAVAREIARRFGEGFTRISPGGHLAIAPPVLQAFRKAAGGPTWNQRGLCWVSRPGRKSVVFEVHPKAVTR